MGNVKKKFPLRVLFTRGFILVSYTSWVYTALFIALRPGGWGVLLLEQRVKYDLMDIINSRDSTNIFVGLSLMQSELTAL